MAALAFLKFKSLRRAFLLFLILWLFLGTSPSFGWLFFEHRQIALIAIQNLDPARRALLDELWAAARVGHEARLSEQVVNLSHGQQPDQIDYAAWMGIAGDHSCSAANMLQTALETRWILDIVKVGAQLEARLAKAKRPDQRTNAVRDSGLKEQRADTEMAQRSASTNAHFMLARPDITSDGRAYVTACVKEGAETNDIGVYVWYHLSALTKAYRLSQESLTSEARSALALAALADEAFGFHFLQDSFASGHATGTWGSAAVRKGTHDYYNDHGFATSTWEGKPVVIMGDAWMRPEDAEHAAIALRKSLEQLLDAATGKDPGRVLQLTEQASSSADDLDVCKLKTLPDRHIDPAAGPLLAEVISQTVQPGLTAGPGEIARFRSELGPFIGIVPAILGSGSSHGFGYEQNMASASGGLETAVRLGVGLEGVLNESGDGLVFLDLGIRQDAASTASFGSAPDLARGGALTAAVPGRSAYTARLRMPFWLIPGDLLIAAPLFLISPGTYMKMAVMAANGGLVPWQAGIATPIGRFQFILGREVGVSLFGYRREEDKLIIPTPGIGSESATLVALRSVQVDFPIVEYRPFRSFSLNQSSSLAVQIFAGCDIPVKVSSVAPPGVPAPDLRTTWHLGLRIAFDWRHYF